MMIFFLGTDVSGKDTIMHLLAKDYTYQIYMSPRSPICNIVYNRLFNRHKQLEEEFFDIIKKFLEMDAFFVMIEVEPEILVKRAQARNEKHVLKIEDFKEHITMYNKVFNECKLLFSEYETNFIKVDNSRDTRSTVETIKQIIWRAL